MALASALRLLGFPCVPPPVSRAVLGIEAAGRASEYPSSRPGRCPAGETLDASDIGASHYGEGWIRADRAEPRYHEDKRKSPPTPDFLAYAVAGEVERERKVALVSGSLAQRCRFLGPCGRTRRNPFKSDLLRGYERRRRAVFCALPPRAFTSLADPRLRGAWPRRPAVPRPRPNSD